MREIIQLSQLDGYDDELESARKARFREFFASPEKPAKRKALERAASLTSLRSSTFISAYEEALGINS